MEREDVITDRNNMIYTYNLCMNGCGRITRKYSLISAAGEVFSGIPQNVAYHHAMEENMLCLEPF